VIQLIRNNDEQALSCKTIWNCQECQECYVNCPGDIDFGAIASVLRQEAKKRGFNPPADEH
jgi:heterodisulfide reductase subunit C